MTYGHFVELEYFLLYRYFLCSREWLNTCVSLNLGLLASATVINQLPGTVP